MMNYAAKLKLPVLPAGQEGFGVSHYSLGEGVRYATNMHTELNVRV
jgi:hypothetical protein